MIDVFVSYGFKNEKGAGAGHVFMELQEFSHTRKVYIEIQEYLQLEYDLGVVTLVNVKELES